MTLPGEIGHIDGPCVGCGTILPAKVLKSGAGYYVGTWCDRCGPHSRESGYYPSPEAALDALEYNTFYRI